MTALVLGVAVWCSKLPVRYCCVAIQRHTNPHKQQLLCAEEQVTPSLAHSCPCTYNHWWQHGVDSLNHSVVQSVAECCRVLQSVAVCCKELQKVESLDHNMLQYVAVCWSVLQCVAVCCDVLQTVDFLDDSVVQLVAAWCSKSQSVDSLGYGVLKCVAVVLQCVAVCCSVLQRVNSLDYRVIFGKDATHQQRDDYTRRARGLK